MENRSLALRYLSEAIKMDEVGNSQVAFAKYLQSLHVLTMYLNEIFASLGFQKMLEKPKEITQVLSIIHDCSDRINVIVNNDSCSKTEVVPKSNETAGSETKPQKTRKIPAINRLQNENMLLLKNYQWRLERASNMVTKTNLKLELERKLVENAIIAKQNYEAAVKKLQKERVDVMEKEMKKLLEQKKNLTEKQKEKQQLYLSVLQHSKNETWTCTWKLSCQEISPSDAVKLIFKNTMRCAEHPLAQWLLLTLTNIKREIDVKLKQHSDLRQLLPEMTEITTDNAPQFEDLSNEFKITFARFGTCMISKQTLSSLQKFVENTASSIAHVMVNVMEIFYLTYKSLLPDDSEEICHRLLENQILDPVWSTFVILYRISNLPSEYEILKTMLSQSSSTPKDFGCSSKIAISSKITENCILRLQSLTKSHSMSEKLKIMVEISKLLCGNSSDGSKRKVGADELLPLLCYVIVQSKLPHLSSECNAIDQLFDMQYMFGEEGYALSTFLTALKYLEIRNVID